MRFYRQKSQFRLSYGYCAAAAYISRRNYKTCKKLVSAAVECGDYYKYPGSRDHTQQINDRQHHASVPDPSRTDTRYKRIHRNERTGDDHCFVHPYTQRKSEINDERRNSRVCRFEKQRGKIRFLIESSVERAEHAFYRLNAFAAQYGNTVTCRKILNYRRQNAYATQDVRGVNISRCRVIMQKPDKRADSRTAAERAYDLVLRSTADKSASRQSCSYGKRTVPVYRYRGNKYRGSEKNKAHLRRTVRSRAPPHHKKQSRRKRRNGHRQMVPSEQQSIHSVYHIVKQRHKDKRDQTRYRQKPNNERAGKRRGIRGKHKQAHDQTAGRKRIARQAYPMKLVLVFTFRIHASLRKPDIRKLYSKRVGLSIIIMSLNVRHPFLFGGRSSTAVTVLHGKHVERQIGTFLRLSRNKYQSFCCGNRPFHLRIFGYVRKLVAASYRFRRAA